MSSSTICSSVFPLSHLRVPFCQPQKLLVLPIHQVSSLQKQSFWRDSIRFHAISDLSSPPELSSSPLTGDNTEDGKLPKDPSKNVESVSERDCVDYDWTEEWYPLYLSKEVPDDAPLGLNVYDRQLVLYKDDQSRFRCFEDRCPHRLAKLSEGQLVDGKLECLYHGWQFEGNGNCVKIPQLPEGAKIPLSVCARSYPAKESQGVVWVWMSRKTAPNEAKLPWFEDLERPGFQDVSTIHEFPYDHSILLENVMDPAHIPISHDRTDYRAKRENACPITFEVTERSSRGFAGTYREAGMPYFLRFEGPCVVSTRREIVDKNGEKHYGIGNFLCRPTGQGKCMIILRFGVTKSSPILNMVPRWLFHVNGCKIFEQDMGFLASQNEKLMQERAPTKSLYTNLKSSDVFVSEYRKWTDKVGQGMPYYIGHNTISLPTVPAVEEHAPAGFVASSTSSMPAKGVDGSMYAPNLANRYFRHIVHCKGCRGTLKSFENGKRFLTTGAIVFAALAILASNRQWKTLLMVSAGLSFVGMQACSYAIAVLTTNFIRSHRV